MKAEETFSSLKKTIKSKFVTEADIKETDKVAVQPLQEDKEELDDRPLYFQLKDNRAKNEELFEDTFKLSKRIHKIDKDEFEFYESLSKKETDRANAVKLNEKLGLDLFRKRQLEQQQNESNAATNRHSHENENENETLPEPEFNFKKKCKVDIQKKILKNILVKKKNSIGGAPQGDLTGAGSSGSAGLESIVADYDSGSDSDSV